MSRDPTCRGGARAPRLLTPRSLFFGALGVFIMSCGAAYHDDVLGSLMIGNHMPGGAFAYFIFIGLAWNGACSAAGLRRLALDTRELSVVLAVTLVSCFPPAEGLFSYFFRVIMLPWYHLQGRALWREHGLLTHFLPPYLFPAPWPGAGAGAAGYDAVWRGYFTGLAAGAGTAPLTDLPFRAWLAPILAWGPLITAGSLAMLSLQFIAHRQWARHEHLPFPVAQVAGCFCRTADGGRGVPLIFKDKFFWLGFTPVALLLGLKILSAWHPGAIPAPGEIFPDFMSWRLPAQAEVPILKNVPGTACLNAQSLSFAVFGIAYFVGLDVSFSMGTSMIMLALAGAVYYLATGAQMEYSHTSSSRFGAGLGYCVMLAATGWPYYKAVFRRALGAGRRGRGKGGAADPGAEGSFADGGAAVAAARVYMLASLAFTAMLSWLCQSWVMAVFYSLVLTVMFMTVSRVVCESGMPFVQSGWLPGEVLLKFFGPAAIGPRPLTFLLWGTGVMGAQDPRECLTPYAATAAKAADDAGVNLRKLFWLLCAAVCAALAISFCTTFYTNYNFNPQSQPWPASVPPVMHLDLAAKHFSAMKAAGVFSASESAGPLARLRFMEPAAVEMHFFAAGLAAMLGLSFLRFRFSRFPLHPVALVMAGTYPSQMVWGSFLAGWLAKALIVRFGGGRIYQRLKPLFTGMIAGELLMAGACVFINFAYYFVNGARAPVRVAVTPW